MLLARAEQLCLVIVLDFRPAGCFLHHNVRITISATSRCAWLISISTPTITATSTSYIETQIVPTLTVTTISYVCLIN